MFHAQPDGEAFAIAVMQRLRAGQVGSRETTRDILSLLDVLVDGKFILERKDLNLGFLAQFKSKGPLADSARGP